MKVKLLFACTLSVLIMVFQNSHAQFVQQINGQPVQTKNYTDIQGTPFLSDEWGAGIVKVSDGTTFKDVPLKYNEVEDILYFKDTKDQLMVFVDPVKEFKITYKVNEKSYTKLFRNGFKNIPNSSQTSFFEVISDGTIQLIKKLTKSLTEVKDYNAPVVKKFEEEEKYYIVNQGNAMPVKKDEKSILAAIGNKQTELSAYIKTNKLRLKSDDDLAKLIAYYNSM